jgi:hypothetical protein
LRARQELDQLEYLSGAFFLGKLLVFPPNDRLDWKVFARCKHSSLLGLIVSNKGKKFYNIDIRFTVIKLFYPALTLPQSKLECL